MADEKLTRKEFLALPMDERRRVLEEQANDPEVIACYEGLNKADKASLDRPAICRDCPTFEEGCEGSNQEDCERRDTEARQPDREKIQHLWCQHCKALQKSNDTVVKCWYNPLDADRAFAFCAANEDAIAHILSLLNPEAIRREVAEEMLEVIAEDAIEPIINFYIHNVEEIEYALSVWEQVKQSLKSRLGGEAWGSSGENE